MPEIHSRLGASSAHRWMSCPGSIRMESGLPSKTSVHAEEGTLAHSFCETALRFYADEISAESKAATQLKLMESDLYSEEMLVHADEYVDYIDLIIKGHIGEDPTILVEQMVNYSDVAPGGFGTADCVLCFGDEMHIIDLKYGRGVEVSAENNPQLKLYGYGAMQELSWMYDPKMVHLHIFQPRLNNYSEWSISAEDLRWWATHDVRDAARQAMSSHPPIIPSAKACRWCKAKNVCAVRAEWLMNDTGVEPGFLTAEEIGKLLPKAKELESWAKELTGEAHSRLMAGEEIPGYKLVKGRQGARRFTNADEAIKRALANGVAEAMLYDRTPISLAAMEKLIGKNAFADMCGDIIIRPEGKPTLVPESDVRQKYDPVAEAFGLEI